MAVDVKICGLTDREAMQTAVAYGADLVGLVFFGPSPRNIAPEIAHDLVDSVPKRVIRVGLFVDPDDALVDSVLSHVPLDAIQLHGNEAPARCAELRQRTGCEIFKAIKVRAAEDLAQADRYISSCARLLFDAKPPEGATRPGGNAERFDWRILEGRHWPLPWLLAGGLTVGNVAAGIRQTGCPGVDASSGLETAPGQKAPELIRQFIQAAKSA